MRTTEARGWALSAWASRAGLTAQCQAQEGSARRPGPCSAGRERPAVCWLATAASCRAGGRAGGLPPLCVAGGDRTVGERGDCVVAALHQSNLRNVTHLFIQHSFIQQSGRAAAGKAHKLALAGLKLRR
jgi:hypothetical protein